MKTITKKIAKNGAEIWYVDGKRVSRETAEFEERNNRRLERFAKSKIAEETAKIEEEPEMKNQNTNAVCTPATIETKIAKNGAAIVYVNGKRTSNEQAVEIAKQNGLPVYQASYLSYTDNGNSETFATALSAYKWLVSKANSNSNIADGSRTITRIAPNQTFITGTEIYDFDNNINVDDEPELATIIYAEIGEEHIKSRYNSMILFHDQLIKDGLTEEQINQVLVVEAGNKNGLAHCKLIKEFKAQNGIVEKKTVVDAGEDKENKFGITVIGHDNRRVNVRPDCKIVAIQSNLWVAGNRIGFYDTPIEAEAAEENLKAAIKNGAGEYMIDGVEVEANVEDYAVSTEAQEVATEAETELATNTATEITPIDAAIETLDDDMKDEVRADIEPYKAEYNAAIKDVYLDDLSGGYDENAEIIPAADLLKIIIPLALTDHSSTAYRKNPDGTFTEDKIAFARLTEVENKIFNAAGHKIGIDNPEPEPPETPIEKITFVAQSGGKLTIEGGMPTIAANGNKLEVNGICIGEYYTNENAQEAAEALKIDVEEFGDDHPVLSKEYFAEIESKSNSTGGGKVAEHLNANAPEGWAVTVAKDKL
ncbi:MAG: hypothetical protein IKN27_08330, partial [Selenomonadaceae bacterium]|nr:hypothetical protein [Selenomonadaceae bacterium]